MCRPSAALCLPRRATQLLVSKKISGLPVVDASGKVLGMIRRALASLRARRATRAPNHFSAGACVISRLALPPTHPSTRAQPTRLTHSHPRAHLTHSRPHTHGAATDTPPSAARMCHHSPHPPPLLARSGYDLLVLDATPGHVDKEEGMFPRIGKCDEFGGSLSRMWTAFSDMQEVISKTGGSTAADVCHEAATVSASARLEDAADVIVRKKVHRLAVLDAGGRCVGILSRGDILKATLQVRAACCVVSVVCFACLCVC